MKELFQKVFSSSERILIRKDINLFWKSRYIRTFMFLIPVIFALFLPVFFLVAICLSPDIGYDLLIDMLPMEYTDYTVQQALFYVFIKSVCPMLYLLVVCLMSSVGTLCEFVGERENGTMETLVRVPIPAKKIFKCKCAANITNAVLISYTSFLALSIVISLGNIILSVPFFFDMTWAVIILFLTPALILFSQLMLFRITLKEKTYLDAFCACGYIIIPFLALFMGQFAGIYTVSAFFLLLISLILIFTDIIMTKRIIKKLSPQMLMGDMAGEKHVN